MHTYLAFQQEVRLKVKRSVSVINGGVLKAAFSPSLTDTHTQIHKHTYTHTYTHTHCMYTHTYTNTHDHAHVCMHVNTHTHTHTHTCLLYTSDAADDC